MAAHDEKNVQLSEEQYLMDNFGVKTVGELTGIMQRVKAVDEFTTKSGFKNADEMIAALKNTGAPDEVVKERDALKAKLELIEPEFNKIKPEYEELKAKGGATVVAPYKTKLSAFVDELVTEKKMSEEQVIDALPLTKLDPDKMKPEEAIKRKMKFENSALGDNHIEALFNKQFVLKETDDYKPTAEELDAKEAEMLGAAQSSRTFLKEFAARKFEPQVNVDAEKQKKEFNELSTFWNSEAPVIVAAERKIGGKTTLNLPGSKGIVEVPVQYDYTLPDTDVKQINADVALAATNGRLANTQADKAKVKDYAQLIIKGKNFEKALEAQAVAMNNQFMDFLHKEFNVEMPQGLNKTAGGAGGSTLTLQEQKEKAIFDNEKRKRQTN